MNKSTLVDIWNNLHPMTHFWIIISSVGVLTLYGLMFYVG